MFLPSNITLKFGDSGDFVAEMQRRLARVGCFSEDQVNSFFDGPTQSAVLSFQAREGLHADGVAGPDTLRRLNGVIAGDTSSSDKKDAEEQAIAQTSIAQEILQPAEPVYDPFAIAEPTHSPYGEDAYRAQAAAVAAPTPAELAPAPQPAPAPAVDHQRQADLATRQEQLLQPLQHNPADTLAHMLAQSAAPALAPAPAPVAPTPPAFQPHPTELAAAATAPAHTQPHPAVEPAAAVAPAAEQAQGIVGRARQFASGMLQKLNDYFEAKLPPSVLKEVQAIGVTMAAAGLKENPIPTGPDLPSRAPDLPSRGPEQTAQRG